MKKLLLPLSFVLPLSFFGQLTTNTASNPESMVVDVFLGYGIQVENVVYTGASTAIGTFSYSGSHFDMMQGLLLTSGTLQNTGDGPQGPNANSGSGIVNGSAGNSLLDSLLNAEITHDASVLEIDFTASGDSVFFNYIFGSEEYLEYVNAGFNDIFALFISGPGITGNKNIAVLPDQTVVSIDNVNPGLNSSYYVDNGDGSTAPFNTDDTYIQYDGFTVPLLAKEAVQTGQTYHLTIVVSDVGDGILDSGIFLEAYSLKSNSWTYVPNKALDLIHIYPNPAENYLSLDYPSNLSGSAKITTINGQIVQSDISIDTKNIDISGLESGIYFLEIATNLGSITKKFSVK